MSKAKILVVDDDASSLELMEAMLVPNGYEIITTNDGSKAVAIIVEKKPDLILLDIMMPGLDGYSTLAKIKENKVSSKIPVVMLTAMGFRLNKELALRFGAVGYITKPVDLLELLKTISRLLPVA
jgi:two-component system cell cycle response regulator